MGISLHPPDATTLDREGPRNVTYPHGVSGIMHPGLGIHPPEARFISRGRETIYHEKREYAFRFYGCAAGCPAAAPCFGKRRRKAPPRPRRSPRRTTKSRSEKKSEDGETVYSAAAVTKPSSFRFPFRFVCLGIGSRTRGPVAILLSALDRAALSHSGRYAQSGQHPPLDEKPHRDNDHQQQQIIHFLPSLGLLFFSRRSRRDHPVIREGYG